MFREIGNELAGFIAWVKERLADSDVRREIALDLGLQPGERVPDANLPKDKLDSIEQYRSQANPDKETFFILLNDIRAVWEAVRAFIRSLGISEITALNQTVYLLFDTLALNYVRLRCPQLYFVAQLIDAMFEDSSAIDESDYTIERFFRSLARLIEFLLSPIGYLFYSPLFGVEDEAEARRVSERTFTLLAAFLVLAKPLGEKFKIPDFIKDLGTNEVILGWDSLRKDPPSPDDQKTPKADEISERMLSFAFVNRQKDKTTGKDVKTFVDVTLAIVPQSHGASGFFVSMGGGGAVEVPLSDKWKLRAGLDSPSAAAFLIQKDLQHNKWSFLTDGPNEARAILAFVSTPDQSGITYKIPNSDETHLAVGQLSFSMVLAADKTELKASAKDCALVLASSGQDGFIGSLLPKDGIRIPINFGVGYSEAKGFFTEGNIPFLSGQSTRSDNTPRSVSQAVAPNLPPLPTLSAGKAPQLGLEEVISIHKSLGPVKIKQLLLGVFPAEDPASPTVAVEVSTSLELALGPVLATLERIGFQFKLGFPENGGNLGFADIALGLKPPLGVGLSINASGVTGGGFLRFDPEKGQYDGIVELTLEDRFAVKGIGLIATRLPDSTKGFSLLIIITAEDLDIQLGLGFKLTAIGGLLAINRTFDETALRAGLKNHILDSILFPKDPIRNAPQILSNLNTVFPPAPGHHLFGPAARIEWGTPTLITADIALVLELGARLRLLALAHIAAILPKPENDLIRLQMAAIGLIDFDQGTAALDATLHDSRLVKKFTLTGDMALRLNWEGQRNFALAVGGLHPAFNPPSNFPKLERITLNLTTGDNPRFRCEAYFALTANTVQFGARAELFAAAVGFSIQGEVGFDVLIQVSPFQFLAEFFAQVQVKRGATNLLKVRVEGALAGPLPLHIKAKATFEVLWWDISVRIDKTLLEGVKPALAAGVNVLAQLLEALGQPGNWVGELPDGQRPMVTLRARSGAANEAPLHPLGTLKVKQNLVPLEMEIAQFGQTTPDGDRYFAIKNISIGGQEQKPQYVRDFFAPAQFFAMSDADKLSHPSFEQMAAGVAIGAHAISFKISDCLQVDAIEFETKIYDKATNAFRSGDLAESANPKQTKQRYTLPGDRLLQQAQFGAAANSDLRRTGKTKYQTTVGKYQVVKEGWSIVATDDLTVHPAPGAPEARAMSYSEAEQALTKLKQQDPVSAARLQILRFQSEVQAVA